MVQVLNGRRCVFCGCLITGAAKKVQKGYLCFDSVGCHERKDKLNKI